jgi:hypothetical protein
MTLFGEADRRNVKPCEVALYDGLRNEKRCLMDGETEQSRTQPETRLEAMLGWLGDIRKTIPWQFTNLSVSVSVQYTREP